jgi:TPP-dependent 2-oxoacid decarboxylase
MSTYPATAQNQASGSATVVGYLLTRLAEAGVTSIFGVPGDDNLGVLDAITTRPSLAWIGMVSEQGAGHAADSYARQRGLGALVTTFGVGELSAMAAIAGAYAESVPVVHIVGTPALAARKPGAAFHHVLPGGGFDHFAQMAAEVTVAQADLRPDTAPAEIDRVLAAALRTSRPVYLSIPADVAGAPVPAPAGRLPQAGREADANPADARPGAATGPAAVTGPAAQTESVAYDAPLTQRDLWASVQGFLRAGDLILADQGAAFCAAASLLLPDGAQLTGPSLLASAGWALPAALGASLAAPDRRVVLILGAGAMQQAAPELGTLLGEGLMPVIIVLNDGGRAMERPIHDVPAWDWLALPAAVAPASSAVTLRASRSHELDWALAAADYHAATGRPVLIEAVLAPDGAPTLLRDPARVLVSH